MNSIVLFQSLTSNERRGILLAVADGLEANEGLINAENHADVEEAEACGYEKSLVSRLVLKPGKVSKILKTCDGFLYQDKADSHGRLLHYYCIQISSLAKSIRLLADMEEPIGCVLKKTEVKWAFKF